MKAILKKNGIDCGGVRKPLPGLIDEDLTIVDAADGMIQKAIDKYC